MLKPDLVFRSYDITKYNLHKIVSDIFKVEELEKLHLYYPQHLPFEALEFKNESITWFHNRFYQELNSSFDFLFEIYNRFIKEEISPLFQGNPFIFQSFPTFRVHLPNNRAISKWHYDSDSDHKHPDHEINFQLPLTKCFASNATWIESKPGAQDFSPMEMGYGEFVQFDGNKCMHGNKLNTTGLTRVSFDFRVMELAKYSESTDKSATLGKSFKVGEYYKIMR